jgi:hypothetical protein
MLLNGFFNINSVHGIYTDYHCAFTVIAPVNSNMSNISTVNPNNACKVRHYTRLIINLNSEPGAFFTESKKLNKGFKYITFGYDANKLIILYHRKKTDPVISH